MEEPKTTDRPIQNAVKLVGEAIVPGASLLMDGQIVKGGAHVLAGIAARALLGPIGVAIVIANSYAQSTTGRGIAKHLATEGEDALKRLRQYETERKPVLEQGAS